MKHDEPISDQLLNAFVDGQLDAGDRARVLQAVQQDPAIAARLAQLQQINSLLAFGYEQPPVPDRTATSPLPRPLSRPRQAIAAAIVLMIGVTLGWWLHPAMQTEKLPLTSLTQLNVQQPGNNRILIHINDMNPRKIDAALSEAEALLDNAHQRGQDIQVEVLANADGLGVFRDHSPYAQRIEQLATQHGNVSFRACGFAIAHAKLKEGHNIKLLPEAKPVDAALEEILRKLKLGWLYVRA
jgi:intracellular sulfur oxidation DsrE/DsrF family protein